MNACFAQLLVHLDASPRAVQRLEAAQHIGSAQGAAVTALYAVTPYSVDLPVFPEIGPGMAASLRDMDDRLRQQARSAFEQSLARHPQAGAQVAWAEIPSEPITAVFAQQALYADLLVLGQHDPASDPPAGVPAGFVENVLAISGKPALILPYAGALPEPVSDTVVIAWKPSREAAHAVSAAMPLLQRARQVHILSWTGEDEAVQGQGLDLQGYLRLRGVNATWHRQGAEPADSLGELLLSRAFDLQASLLVMGCYGHSRAREWVLGGTTRTVLQCMTLPVLMAH